jgi:hypothetical protein
VEIWHRLTFGHRDMVDIALAREGTRIQRSPLPGGGYLLHVDIGESSPRWPEMADLIERTGAVDVCETVFTAEEILRSDWCRLIPSYEQGYPQPEKGMAWRSVVYDEVCPECGVGYHQTEPFRLRKEPTLGKKVFVSLHWTHAVFCSQPVLGGLHALGASGCEVWRAVLHGTGGPSQVISQLVFPNIAAPGLSTSDLRQPEWCARCGIAKFSYHNRGYMNLARAALDPALDFQQTDEWFGGGTKSGFREIIVSNRAARMIVENRWQGLTLKPINAT